MKWVLYINLEQHFDIKWLDVVQIKLILVFCLIS